MTETEPTESWTYRNFNCRVYRLDGIAILGYVQIGDEWEQVIDYTPDVDMDTVIEHVNDEVDGIIHRALKEYDDSDPFDFPDDGAADPDPFIDPNPDPFPQIDPDPDPFPDTEPFPPYRNPWWADSTSSSTEYRVDLSNGNVMFVNDDEDDDTDDQKF